MKSKRLKDVREYLGMQQGEIANLVDVAQSYYSNIESPKSKKSPSKRVIEALKKLFAINPDYIEKAKGEMFITEGYDSTDYIVQTIHQLGYDIMYFCRKAGITIQEFGRLRKNDINHPVLKDHVERIKAKELNYTGETPVYKALPKQTNKQFTSFKYPVLKRYDIGYIIETDDMAPVLNPGDLVLANVNDTILIFGAIYVIVCRNTTLVRVVRRSAGDENKILLVSKNQDYDDLEIEKSIILELYLVKQAIKIQGL